MAYCHVYILLHDNLRRNKMMSITGIDNPLGSIAVANNARFGTHCKALEIAWAIILHVTSVTCFDFTPTVFLRSSRDDMHTA